MCGCSGKGFQCGPHEKLPAWCTQLAHASTGALYNLSHLHMPSSKHAAHLCMLGAGLSSSRRALFAAGLKAQVRSVGGRARGSHCMERPTTYRGGRSWRCMLVMCLMPRLSLL